MNESPAHPPPSEFFQIEPSDDTDLPFPTSAIVVGEPGEIVVLLASSDEPVTLITPRFFDENGDELIDEDGEPAKVSLPLSVRRVFATGTTAAHLIGVVA